jgi:hypothetical protein
MCILLSTALEHMLAIIHRAETPSEQKLAEEFITREDFLSWCKQSGEESPNFLCVGVGVH